MTVHSLVYGIPDFLPSAMWSRCSARWDRILKKTRISAFSRPQVNSGQFTGVYVAVSYHCYCCVVESSGAVVATLPRAGTQHTDLSLAVERA